MSFEDSACCTISVHIGDDWDEYTYRFVSDAKKAFPRLKARAKSAHKRDGVDVDVTMQNESEVILRTYSA